MRSPTVVGEASQANAWGRVLLIDDERRILDFVARGLRAEGYTVEVAEDAPQGLAEALAHPYDLIILDLLMPPVDGRVILRITCRASWSSSTWPTRWTPEPRNSSTPR